MIKALANLDDGKKLIVLGLSQGNVDRLKENDPIVFNLSSLGLPKKEICISCKTEDGKAAIPVGFNGTALCFTTKKFEEMKSTPEKLEFDDINFCIFVGSSEEEIQFMTKGLIDHKTVVKTEGYSPSDKPTVSRN